MTTEQLVIVIESVVLAVMLVSCCILIAKSRKNKKSKANNVFIKNGVRYTRNETEMTESGEMQVTHRVDDIILDRGITYIVTKGGKIIPGKYTVLSVEEGDERFNLRLGDFVREYEHASDIVLSEGETVCAVSHSVILR